MSEGAHNPPPSRGPVLTTLDVVSENPYGHFVVSEFWAALAGTAVYLIFRVASLLVQQITTYIPITDLAPGHFLELVLSWMGASSAAATFTLVTVYQLVILGKRLMERMRS